MVSILLLKSKLLERFNRRGKLTRECAGRGPIQSGDEHREKLAIIPVEIHNWSWKPLRGLPTTVFQLVEHLSDFMQLFAGYEQKRVFAKRADLCHISFLGGIPVGVRIAWNFGI